jgi:hypothetical protein
MDAKPPNSPRPYWFPEEIDLAALPKEVQLAVSEILNREGQARNWPPCPQPVEPPRQVVLAGFFIATGLGSFQGAPRCSTVLPPWPTEV